MSMFLCYTSLSLQTTFPYFFLTAPIMPCLSPSLMRSGHKFTGRVFLTSSLEHLAPLISTRTHNICLRNKFLSSHREWESRKESGTDIISSHPVQWCEGRHGVHTSTPLGRCLCTDTAASGLWRLSWSKCLQCGRRKEYPGHCSDLREEKMNMETVSQLWVFWCKVLQCWKVICR